VEASRWQPVGSRQKAEGRKRKAEGRKRKAESGRQKAESRRQKAAGGRLEKNYNPLSPAPSPVFSTDHGSRQKAEGKKQKAESSRQQVVDGKRTTIPCAQPLVPAPFFNGPWTADQGKKQKAEIRKRRAAGGRWDKNLRSTVLSPNPWFFSTDHGLRTTGNGLLSAFCFLRTLPTCAKILSLRKGRLVRFAPSQHIYD
jgi:hypothetical protein